MSMCIWTRVQCMCTVDLSNPDTLETEDSVLISEVSWFQGLQTLHLGRLNVSCLLRCTHFWESWLEGFHCIHVYWTCSNKLSVYRDFATQSSTLHSTLISDMKVCTYTVQYMHEATYNTRYIQYVKSLCVVLDSVSYDVLLCRFVWRMNPASSMTLFHCYIQRSATQLHTCTY